jgi:hypothetical protein
MEACRHTLLEADSIGAEAWIRAGEAASSNDSYPVPLASMPMNELAWEAPRIAIYLDL